MEEDSGPKPNKEKEAKSSAEKDAGMTAEIGNVDPSLGYIVVCQCGRVISEKELQLLWVWQPISPGERLPKGNAENHKEGRFKLERGDGKEGRLVL